jgi:hypothetical protein
VNARDLTATFTVGDVAGNTTKVSSAPFTIDTHAPLATLSFDNDQVANTRYFKAQRTATLRVSDLTFTPSLLDVSAPGAAQSGFAETTKASSTEPGTYVDTIAFARDGTYTLSVSGTDGCGNALGDISQAAGTTAPYAFTIDTVAPRLSITYTDGGGVSGAYYAKAREATLSVTDADFSAEGSVLSSPSTSPLASFDKDAPAFPKPTSWRSAGKDTYSATLDFSGDGRYAYGLTSTDLAGNTAALTCAPFALDTTAPVVDIEGVAAHSAYRDTIAPMISLTDDDFQASHTTLTLSGARCGEVALAGKGSWKDIQGGEVFSFDDFKRVEASDDIYTLAASTTDKAGNTTSDSLTFSVNRFGSTYSFDKSLAAVNGTYIKTPVPVGFYEVNVSPLRPDTTSVRLSRNGSPAILPASAYSRTLAYTGAGFSVYTYTLPASTFASDGAYILDVSDHDEAGNLNDNEDVHKDASIDFAVDGTAPLIIVPAPDTAPGAPEHLSATVRDNLRLRSVTMALDGKPLSYSHAAGTDSYDVTIPAASRAQVLTIKATDMAGNIATYTSPADTTVASPLGAMRDVLSSLPPSTGPLLALGIVGAALIVAAACALIWALRRRKARHAPTADEVYEQIVREQDGQ